MGCIPIVGLQGQRKGPLALPGLHHKGCCRHITRQANDVLPCPPQGGCSIVRTLNIHVHAHTRAHTHTHTHTHTYTHTYVHTHTHIPTYNKHTYTNIRTYCTYRGISRIFIMGFHLQEITMQVYKALYQHAKHAYSRGSRGMPPKEIFEN